MANTAPHTTEDTMNAQTIAALAKVTAAQIATWDAPRLNDFLAGLDKGGAHNLQVAIVHELVDIWTLAAKQA